MVMSAEGHGQPRVLPGFLPPDEREFVLAFAADGVWEDGRLGTGYQKRDLSKRPQVQGLIDRALLALGAEASMGWDCHLLRYEGNHRGSIVHEAPSVRYADICWDFWRTGGNLRQYIDHLQVY